MAQITIYLDRETEALVNRAVRQSGVSKSRWIAAAVRARAGSEWPAGVVGLQGAWADFPDLKDLRQTTGRDRKRGRL
ncbi:MAG: ribbon-helix-helix protein, CopG family [Acidobacteria bacterium]|nr:ribbon-helix-helix protein, CopG family [Acidobacteriota bacterium]